MIDIAFSKLAIIGVAALVFIGPEKLPKVARMAGTLFGRAQRYINDVKSEVSREMELDELRKMRDTVQQAATGFENTVQSELNKTESELNQHAIESGKDLYCFFYGVTPELKQVPSKKNPEQTFGVFSANIENLDHLIIREAPTVE